MVYPFICGVGSLPHQLEQEDEFISPCSTPTTIKPTKLKKSKNPFADRGRDKFSTLLAELEDKKQKIITQLGPDEISMVRFSYPNNSSVCKPIVVRREKQQQRRSFEKDRKPVAPVTTRTEKSEDLEKTSAKSSASANDQLGDEKAEKKGFFSWNLKMGMLKSPAYYLPAAIIVILLLMAVSGGRSFAILCTSIGWYMVPMIKGGSSDAKRPRKKKVEYERRAYIDRKSSFIDGLSSPTSVITGSMTALSSPPRRRGHQKSWS